MALLKASVTCLLFYFLFRRVDFHEFAATLRNARLDILFGAFLVMWLGHYICIFRWRMLMRPVMQTLSLSQLFNIYCIGLFFNLTFPTVVGGDVVKMYYAGKPERKFAESFAATFLDRNAGMLAMMMIACTASLLYPIVIPGVPVWFIIWSAFFAFLAANFVIFTPSLHRRFTDLLNRLRQHKIAVRIDTISNVFQIIGRHRVILMTSLLISLVNQWLVIAVTWIMAKGLNIEVSLMHFMVIVPAVTLISMIPVSLNGMGLREYAFVSLLGAIGVDREAGIALGLLSSAVVVISSIPGGVIYIFFRNRSDVQQIAALETDFT